MKTTTDHHQISLSPGYGYWDVTNYPLGGKFCRVPRDSPLPLDSATVELLPAPSPMADFTVRPLGDSKRKIAVKAAHLETPAMLALQAAFESNWMIGLYGCSPFVTAYPFEGEPTIEAWRTIEERATVAGFALDCTSAVFLKLRPI